MTVTLTQLSASGAAKLPAKGFALAGQLLGEGTKAAAAVSSGQGQAQGFEGVFAALLNLAQNAVSPGSTQGSAQGGAQGTVKGDAHSPLSILTQMGVDRSALNKVSLDLGGKIDLAAILAAGTPASDKVSADAQSSDKAKIAEKAKPADPLAAVIDQILAGLKNLMASPNGPQGGASPQIDANGKATPATAPTQKLLAALSGLVSAIEAKAGAQPPNARPGGNSSAPQFAQLDPALLDQLKTISQDLRQLIAGPQSQSASLSGSSDPASALRAATQISPPQGGQITSDNAQLTGTLRQLAHRVDAILTGTPAQAANPPAAQGANPPANVLQAAQLANPATAAGLVAGNSLLASNSANSGKSQAKTDIKTDTKGASDKSMSGTLGPASGPAQTASGKKDSDAAKAMSEAAAGGGGASGGSSNQGDAALAPFQPAASQTASAQAAFRPVSGPGFQLPQQIAIPALAYEFARQVSAGNTSFAIRLDPPELGKIDVKLNIDKTGALHARLTVERAETLDLLQRDARGLERALSQAGLDGNKTNLEFSLRQNPFAGQQFAGQQHGRGGEGQGQPAWSAADPIETESLAPGQAVEAYRGIATPGGINLLA